MRNIVETAREAGSFKTLLAAAESAGLAETLRSTGPSTVFAPSDEAFAQAPSRDSGEPSEGQGEA